MFAPPKSAEVAGRLVEEEGGVEENMHQPLALYHRHHSAILSAYTSVSKTFNADQPMDDLFDQSEWLTGLMVVQLYLDVPVMKTIIGC